MLVREMLNARCSPNERFDSNGNTALMIAAKHQNTAITQVLIDAGADPPAQNNSGHDAVHFGHDPSTIQEPTEITKPRRSGWLVRTFGITCNFDKESKSLCAMSSSTRRVPLGLYSVPNVAHPAHCV